MILNTYELKGLVPPNLLRILVEVPLASQPIDIYHVRSIFVAKIATAEKKLKGNLEILHQPFITMRELF
jgi:hypothetical protein